jgi:poly(hydroxyalkanoate) granule-associated protein
MTKTKKSAKQADFKESAQTLLLAGLGALSVAEEEGKKFFKNLVKKGEAVQDKNKERIATLKDEVENRVETAKGKAEDAWDKISDRLDERLTSTLHRLGVPTKDEIHTLTRRVEELTKAVDRLKPRTAARPKAPTAAKAAAKETPAE